STTTWVAALLAALSSTSARRGTCGGRPGLLKRSWDEVSLRAGRSLSWVATSGRLPSDPDRCRDHHADADGPHEQRVPGRADAAQAGAAVGVAAVLDVLEEGDHVLLLLRGEVLVVEHRHRLRAGDHRLVNVLRLHAHEGRGVLAPGQRSPG